MLSNRKILSNCSLHRRIPTIIIVCMSVWWASADTLAQTIAPAALKITAESLWSFEGPGSNAAPHLVIGKAEREDPSSYGSVWPARNEAADSFAFDQGGASVCCLLEYGPALGSFLYDHRVKHCLSNQWLAKSNVYLREADQASPPLLRRKVRGPEHPVALSSAAGSP
jgi:hypothetical protein